MASSISLASLADVLAYVPANDITRSHVEYLDRGLLAEVFGPNKHLYASIDEIGLGGLTYRASDLDRVMGIDPDAMRTRVVVGYLTESSGLWLGDYDVARVNAWLEGHGGQREAVSGDATRWRTAPDRHEVDDSSPMERVAPAGSLNVVRTAPGSFIWSVEGDPVTWLTESSEDTLADDQATAELAEILGEVQAAVIERHVPSGVAYAMGLHIASPQDVTEVACVRATTVEQARSLHNQIQDELEAWPPGTIVDLTGPSDTILRLKFRDRPRFPVGAAFHNKWRLRGLKV